MAIGLHANGGRSQFTQPRKHSDLQVQLFPYICVCFLFCSVFRSSPLAVPRIPTAPTAGRLYEMQCKKPLPDLKLLVWQLAKGCRGCRL